MITSCTPGTHLTHLTSFFIGLNQPSTKKALFKHNKGHLGSSEPSLWTPWTCIILTLYRWKISIKIRYSACINPTMETSLVVLKCVCVWKKKQPVEAAERRKPAPPGMYETPMNDGINYLSTGAGFLPSTVCHGSNVTHDQKLHHIVRSPFLWGFGLCLWVFCTYILHKH